MAGFGGFQTYCESQPDFISVVKHQLPVTATAFQSMAVAIPAGTVIGKKRINQTMSAYVCAVDDGGVTLCNEPPKTVPFTGEEWDDDGEYDDSPGNQNSGMRFTVTHDQFRKLLTPPPAAAGGPPM